MGRQDPGPVSLVSFSTKPPLDPFLGQERDPPHTLTTHHPTDYPPLPLTTHHQTDPPPN